MNRALFLDRDGTVIEDPGYLRDANNVRFLPGALEALSSLARRGWKLIVISNQSGVGRGLIRPGEMEEVQARFLDLMAASHAPVTASYVCIHAPEDNCECRKPSPLFLERAAREHALDLAASYMDGALPTFVASNWKEIRERLASEGG
jgi:D-glycero-D-manno-heptose 1,7-bisphosphate phosphatase